MLCNGAIDVPCDVNELDNESVSYAVILVVSRITIVGKKLDDRVSNPVLVDIVVKTLEIFVESSDDVKLGFKVGV